MERRNKVVVFGVTGLVGFAAAKRFARDPLWDVVGVARRRPAGLAGVECLSLDLSDRDACRAALSGLRDVTHVVYAALFEKPGLFAGWTERDQMETNLAMLQHALGPLLDSAPVRHVTLLQGTKAYGAHVAPMRVPGRERDPRHPHENFYWLQEDELRERQSSSGYGFTILRPVVIFGEALGANMNPIPALGSYAAILRAQDRALDWPGGLAQVTEAVDADLLADVIHWAAESPAAADQTFNVTNGDVFTLRNLWPTLADALGMRVGDAVPMRLATELPKQAETWAALHDRFGLRAPRDLAAFVGQSLFYADMLTGYGFDALYPPALVSTIKLRQSGFASCMDTEDMLRKWIAHHQRIGYLPPREW